MDSANEGTPLVGAAATNTFSVSFRNESDLSNSKGNVNVATPDSNAGYSKGILSKGILGKGNGGKGSGSGTGSYVKRDSSGYPSLGSTFAGISEPVTRGWLLLFFNLVSLLACITGALISFFQTITLLLAYDLVFQDTMCIILVVYQVVFGIIIVLVEMEWTEFVWHLYILKSWVFRGLAYVYVGLSGWQTQQRILSSHSRHYGMVYLTSSALVAIGVLYFVMGAICLKRVRDKKLAKYIQLLSNFEMQSAIKKIKNMDESSKSKYYNKSNYINNNTNDDINNNNNNIFVSSFNNRVNSSHYNSSGNSSSYNAV